MIPRMRNNFQKLSIYHVAETVPSILHKLYYELGRKDSNPHPSDEDIKRINNLPKVIDLRQSGFKTCVLILCVLQCLKDFVFPMLFF